MQSVVRHHSADLGVLTRIVRFVAGTLVPLIVVAPTRNVLLPSERATGWLPGAGLAELLDGSLLQPTIKMAADMIPKLTALFIKHNDKLRHRQTGTPNNHSLLGQTRCAAADCLPRWV